MASISLATARLILNSWIEAEQAVALGQSYTIGGQTYTRVDANVITKKIQFWSTQVSRLERGNGGIKRQYAVPK